jgi:hypothetical protein
MTGEKVDFEQAAAEKVADSRRERSTIQFPYGDLEDAEAIASAIHRNAGDKCTAEQLATYMKQSPTSGTFRLKVATASTFGLTDNKCGEVALTELGRRILDPNQQRRARTEAFLGVPLYAAIFNKYNGYMLPPPKALEREMDALGVSAKQTDKARQAFERSASRAAYFEHGGDRLTMPAKLDSGPETLRVDSNENQNKRAGGGSGGGGDFPPLIQGLIERLPPPDSVWPVQKRKQWLQTAENIFSLIYLDSASEPDPWDGDNDPPKP